MRLLLYVVCLHRSAMLLLLHVGHMFNMRMLLFPTTVSAGFLFFFEDLTPHPSSIKYNAFQTRKEKLCAHTTVFFTKYLKTL